MPSPRRKALVGYNGPDNEVAVRGCSEGLILASCSLDQARRPKLKGQCVGVHWINPVYFRRMVYVAFYP
jgi:hypothetical protein